MLIQTVRKVLGLCELGCLGCALLSFVHVLDITFENQEIWSRPAINLQGASIVPLDRSFDLFAVLQDNYHRGVRVDLFLVIVNLGVCLVGWWLAFAHLDWSLRLRSSLLRSSSAMSISVRSIAMLRCFSFSLDVSQGSSN